MLIKIYPQNPNPREIEKVAAILQDDGVIIYPTDSVYAFGCSLKSKKGLERILKMKGIKQKDVDFSIICTNLSNLSHYAKVDNATFKLMKKNLPGPFTFILPASNRIPDTFLDKKKTVGIRIPENPIPIAITEALGIPMITTSLKDDDEIIEYTTDPELIYERYGHLVDLTIDGGYGGNIGTTVVNCTSEEFEIVREGKGELIE
ncbi:L-threonylcarbamoyladenylate synthase [Alistipes sp. ZOR0009]|jgi:tRNA threonylcarbamoyl adenosine modification protein (Sua5/YciO/YrdC/YwlC family)|uniref:L-threonylcarbamoyladenylate synthase n=1 Tax=Alistipes sp. ZOR0009 TaxID=1339253 RepID=UPI000646A8CC|nr:L-threonylcarbamoyladenylate synthase [Alistipes sp. ZOR0009]